MHAPKKYTTIFFLAAIFLAPFSVYLPAHGAEGTSKNYDCKGFVCCSEGYDCDFDAVLYNLGHIVREILKYAFVFMALMFAFAGFKYIKSAGNPSAIAEAHSMFKKAIIGTLIVLLSFMIVELITTSLGLDEGIILLN